MAGSPLFQPSCVHIKVCGGIENCLTSGAVRNCGATTITLPSGLPAPDRISLPVSK